MTPKQLLNQRYKVIAPYPGIKAHDWKVGDILDRNWCEYQNGDEDAGIIEWQISDCPANFQPLHWYAERELSDMPEYVRYSDYYLNHYHLEGEYKEKIFKVDKWEKGHYGTKATGDGIIHGYEMNFVPTTSEEYEAYNLQKK